MAIGESASWTSLTYREIKERGDEDGSIAIIPVGSVEQHGHHLPVGTDTLLVDSVAGQGVERATDEIPVLVTPPVWSGLSPHHMPFGGTISISVETMIQLLTDIAQSVLENGFDSVLFLNGHGGNASLLDTVVTKIGSAHTDVEILHITYIDLAAPFIDEYRESDTGGMAHGGEFETSLMLHLHPELVRLDRSEAAYLDDPYDLRAGDLFDGGPLSIYRAFSEYSDSGAIGDPDLATEEKGAEIFRGLCDALADLLQDIHQLTK